MINDSELKTDLVLNFTGEVDYEIEENPGKLVLEVSGVKAVADYKVHRWGP